MSNQYLPLSLIIEDHKSSIRQLLFRRGQELGFKLSDDWKVDYESYKWRKIDSKDPEAKTLVRDYIT